MFVHETKKKWLKLFLTCTFALGCDFAYAQNNPSLVKEGSGHSGGGNVTEADLRSYMSKIDTYLQSPEGKLVFPEIVQYDKVHGPLSFHELLLATRPSVKAGKLYDANGEERDCMSYADNRGRYFICNSNALPEKTLNNQPSFYRIVLHELLVQAGIEKPISKAVPSDYAVSYRITENVHLETYQEWVPGKAIDSPQDWSYSTDCKVNLVDFRVYEKDAEVLAEIQKKNFTVVTKASPFKLRLDTVDEGVGTKWMFGTGFMTGRLTFEPNRTENESHTVAYMQKTTVYTFGKGRSYVARTRRLPRELFPKAEIQEKKSVIEAIRKMDECPEYNSWGGKIRSHSKN